MNIEIKLIRRRTEVFAKVNDLPKHKQRLFWSTWLGGYLRAHREFKVITKATATKLYRRYTT